MNFHLFSSITSHYTSNMPAAKVAKKNSHDEVIYLREYIALEHETDDDNDNNNKDTTTIPSRVVNTP